MSKSSTSSFSFARVLNAAINKGEAPALVADAVADAARKYAFDGGAKPLVESVIKTAQTTSTGKPRNPAANTLPGMILLSMQRIMKEAESVGARPSKGADVKARADKAETFADVVRASFVAAVVAATDARKAQAEARKNAPKVEPVAVSDTTEESEGQQAQPAPKVLSAVAVADKVAELVDSMTPEQLADLVRAHAGMVKRITDMAGMIHAVADVVAMAKAPAKPVTRVKGGKVAPMAVAA